METMVSIHSVLAIQNFQNHDETILTNDKQKTLTEIAEKLAVLYSKMLTQEGRENQNILTFGFHPKTFPSSEVIETFKKAFKTELIQSLKQSNEIKIYHKDLKLDKDFLGKVLYHDGLHKFRPPLEQYFGDRSCTSIKWEESKSTFVIQLSKPAFM